MVWKEIGPNQVNKTSDVPYGVHTKRDIHNGHYSSRVWCVNRFRYAAAAVGESRAVVYGSPTWYTEDATNKIIQKGGFVLNSMEHFAYLDMSFPDPQGSTLSLVGWIRIRIIDP